MDYTGNVTLTIIIDSPAELEAEGDRIFSQHAAWMEDSHYREGEKALLQYNVAKTEVEDGRVVFVLSEVYASEAGIADHIAQAQQDDHYAPFIAWRNQCQVTVVRSGMIVHSLW